MVRRMTLFSSLYNPFELLLLVNILEINGWMNELFLLFFSCSHLGNAANLNQRMTIIWKKK